MEGHRRGKMMPLNMIGTGNSAFVRRVSGNEETRRYLGSLDFVNGAEVHVVSEIGGNVIVGIKDSRIAINKDMASHILV